MDQNFRLGADLGMTASWDALERLWGKRRVCATCHMCDMSYHVITKAMCRILSAKESRDVECMNTSLGPRCYDPVCLCPSGIGPSFLERSGLVQVVWDPQSAHLFV